MVTFERSHDEPDDQGERWRLLAAGEVVAEGPEGHWASEAARRALQRVYDRLHEEGL